MFSCSGIIPIYNSMQTSMGRLGECKKTLNVRLFDWPIVSNKLMKEGGGRI